MMDRNENLVWFMLLMAGSILAVLYSALITVINLPLEGVVILVSPALLLMVGALIVFAARVRQKPDPPMLQIREQEFFDADSGIHFYFEIEPQSQSPYRIALYSYGRVNREVRFGADGVFSGAGVFTHYPTPTWMGGDEGG